MIGVIGILLGPYAWRTLWRRNTVFFCKGGPPPLVISGIEVWSEIPFDSMKNTSQCYSRAQILAAYALDDWFSEDSLAREAELAFLYRLPHALGQKWRGLDWRPQSKNGWIELGNISSNVIIIMERVMDRNERHDKSQRHRVRIRTTAKRDLEPQI